MTRPGGDAPRSSDPRKRAVQSPPSATSARLAAAVGALVVAAVLVVFVAIESRPDDQGPSTVAKDHAEAACELTWKAQEATGADIEARAGVAALILDRATLESARAAELAPSSLTWTRPCRRSTRPPTPAAAGRSGTRSTPR